jgi:hypothetical protein
MAPLFSSPETDSTTPINHFKRLLATTQKNNRHVFLFGQQQQRSR